MILYVTSTDVDIRKCFHDTLATYLYIDMCEDHLMGAPKPSHI